MNLLSFTMINFTLTMLSNIPILVPQIVDNNDNCCIIRMSRLYRFILWEQIFFILLYFKK